MEGRPTYRREYRDFDDIHPWAFFQLRNMLQDRPNLRLGKKLRYHKWGFLRLLLKGKSWRAFLRGEIADASGLKFRPITSFYQNAYKAWYSLAGRTLTLLAYILYPRGSSVQSTNEVLAALARYNNGAKCRRGKVF